MKRRMGGVGNTVAIVDSETTIMKAPVNPGNMECDAVNRMDVGRAIYRGELGGAKREST